LTKTRSIKRRATYSAKELAKLYKVHLRTVQGWHCTGMRAIDEHAHPLLFLGSEVKRFRNESRKRWHGKLGRDEFLCLTCHRPVRSTAEGFCCESTGKLLGESKLQVRLRGICQVCGGNLSRLGSVPRFNGCDMTATVKATE